MGDIRFEDEERRFRACPHCTIQIPADEVKCPHCGLFVPPPEERTRRVEEEVDLVEAIRARKREKKRRTLRLWAVSLVVIVLVGLGTLAVKKLTEIPVVVTPVEGFQVKDVRIERKEGKRYLVGTLVDEAVDAPLFSLTSIGVRVMVETGERVFVDTIYPLGPIGEPGALKKGEEGEFSVLLPEGKILRVILTPRVVDLGKEKKFYRPRRRRRR